MDYKYTGIILAKRDVGETDRLYTIYTFENGKIQALAKGVRKLEAKLAGNLENFTLADLSVVKNQGTGKITGSIIENNFSKLKKNPEALFGALESMRKFNQLVDLGNQDEKLFFLLMQYLETLDSLEEKNREKIELVSQGFLFQLLRILGYTIEIRKCVHCAGAISSGKNNFFSLERGGIICESCETDSGDRLLISDNAIKIMRIFSQNSLKAIVKLQTGSDDRRLLDNILRQLLEHARA
jgi:DNA repair protein RecO (recombination protein O)